MSVVQDRQTFDTREAFADYLERRVPATNPPEMQRLSVALYRLLGRGAPASRARLGAACGLSQERVQHLLHELTPSAVVLDERDAVIAFGGLSLVPTHHQFVLEGSKLYTWCVFDALFLPQILRKPAILVTRCPGSGAELTVELTPGGVHAARPSGCVMSTVAPETQACCDNLRASFCDHVNLFKDEQTFTAWARGRGDVGCLSLDDAVIFAHRRNALRYPDVDLAREDDILEET
jgi:alkylmercury lyase